MLPLVAPDSAADKELAGDGGSDKVNFFSSTISRW